MPDKPTFERVEDSAEELVNWGRTLIRADRYVVVFALLVVVILTNAFVGGAVGLLAMLGVLAVTLILTLATSDVGWRTVAVSAVAVVLAIAVGFATRATGAVGDIRLGYQLAIIAMGAIVAVVIARRIAQHPAVSVDTVAGAAAIYLLIGLVFAVLFALVGDVIVAFQLSPAAAAGLQHSAARAFFSSARVPLPSDFLYFSFVTLTTVGYGDLTAASQFGRMLSVSEALLGQLYLVTVVAVLISNYRSDSKRAQA